MKKLLFTFFVFLTFQVQFISCTPKTSTENEETENETESSNLIKNGDFSEGTKHWDIWLSNGTADMLCTKDEQLEIRIKNPGPYEYAIQPYYDGFALYRGGVYRYSFDVSCTIERTFEWRLQINGRDYHAYVGDWASVGKDKKHIECEFTMREPTDFSPRLVMNVGKGKGCPEKMGAHSLFFDNFSLELVDSSGITDIIPEKKSSKINLNQVGYRTQDTKLAIVKSKGSAKIGGNFSVIDTKSGKTVLTGKLKNPRLNDASSEQTAVADFSAVRTEGNYKIVCEPFGESFTFSISDNVYDELLQKTVRFFYMQRCGEAIKDADFAHPKCHTSKAVVYGDVDRTFDVSGGWHDAGDYGRYVVPAAKAVADLMLAYENNRSSFASQNLLAEVKYELDWMLKMQDKDTGAVWHKVTCQNFPGDVMPEEETDKLVLCPVSTTATADFAAAMAMASRFYPNDSAKYLAASEKAWAYLEKTPSDKKGFKNPILFTTGTYDDANDTDERFWAAAELYKTTGKEKYLSSLTKYDTSSTSADFGWQQVALYGMYAYLTSDAPKDAFYKKTKSAFFAKADEKLKYSDGDSYGAAHSRYGYVWGSNMGIANSGLLFLLADKLGGNEKYKSAAKKQLDYLLGTNTTSYCFVTGFGTLSPVLPHHRPSQVVKKPVPGMLVGGPDSKLDDPFAKANLSDAPRAACYIDSAQSFSCNEVTIYWNSPLVALIAEFVAK